MPLPLSEARFPPVPDEAEPAGIAFRGAPRVGSPPPMPYTVNRRVEAWSDNLHELVEKAKARQWNATTDIPWEEAVGVDPRLERALAQALTWMVQQEYAAWYVPAKFLPRINPAYTEAAMFLSTQVMDEARHAEVFLKRIHVNGAGLQEVSPSTESSIKGLLHQEDFARASFLLHVLGEGTFKDLFHLLIDVAPERATREIMTRALEDEARHVAYGVGRLRVQMAEQKDPDALGAEFARALEQRLSFTYEVSGVPANVRAALVELAGGATRVERFEDELHRNRRRRLLEAGFSASVADRIGDLHVRSAGGLM